MSTREKEEDKGQNMKFEYTVARYKNELGNKIRNKKSEL